MVAVGSVVSAIGVIASSEGTKSLTVDPVGGGLPMDSLAMLGVSRPGGVEGICVCTFEDESPRLNPNPGRLFFSDGREVPEPITMLLRRFMTVPNLRRPPIRGVCRGSGTKHFSYVSAW